MFNSFMYFETFCSNLQWQMLSDTGLVHIAVFPKWSEFGESDKSLMHELESI